jgi:peptidoglycan/LPS O-acetylase OafA/YrhL
MNAPASSDVPMTDDGPTRSGPLYVATFDGIRGFVVLTVVMAHVFYFTGWAPGPEFLLGLRRSVFFSVDFLFLISGFVLFLPVVARGRFGSVRSYALRRIGRIVPAYYVSIAITLAVLAVFPPFIPAPNDAPAVLAHLGFVQFQAYGQPFVGLGMNGVWWTLSTIALFYVTLPLIAGRYLRHPFLGLALAILIAVPWQLYVGDPLHDSATSWSAQFPYFLDDFAIGMTAAAVYVALRRGLPAQRLRRASMWVLVPATIALVVLLYVSGRAVARGETVIYAEGPLLSVAVAAAFAIVVVASAFAPRAVQWPLANPVSRWLGEISFGVFLYHFILIYLGLHLLRIPPDGSLASMIDLAAFVVPASLVVAWVSHVTIERPLRERIRRFGEPYKGDEGRRPQIPRPALATVGVGPDQSSRSVESAVITPQAR